ncbi:hypothetical protein GCL60_13265 [Silvanigrella paludirubra]|uniref:Uncharacterized protein n=1 Tax=Silvanigrella paludirubra TaxID=2499159 RepID=A0A6N6VNS4_9BACT|nr:hypothetical protein [Silvanigrella paludirubra]KAB8036808.1 hypothetical protein GCL60_13265 [Silvanigrella paludirubra]
MDLNHIDIINLFKRNWKATIFICLIISTCGIFFSIKSNKKSYKAIIPVKITYQNALENGVNTQIVNLDYYIQSIQELCNNSIRETFKNENSKAILIGNSSVRTSSITITSLENFDNEKINNFLVTLNKKIDERNQIFLKNNLYVSSILNENLKNSRNISEAAFNSEAQIILKYLKYIKDLQEKTNNKFSSYANILLSDSFKDYYSDNLTKSQYSIDNIITLSLKIRKISLIFLNEIKSSNKISETEFNKLLKESNDNYYYTITELNNVKKMFSILEQNYLPNVSSFETYIPNEAYIPLETNLKNYIIFLSLFIGICFSFIYLIILSKIKLLKNRNNKNSLNA